MLPDWQPRNLLGVVEALSVNVEHTIHTVVHLMLRYLKVLKKCEDTSSCKDDSYMVIIIINYILKVLHTTQKEGG